MISPIEFLQNVFIFRLPHSLYMKIVDVNEESKIKTDLNAAERKD